jgi:hypothetical protein
MKIEKENKKVYKVVLKPEHSFSSTEYVIAKTKEDAFELAKKLYASREVLLVSNVEFKGV